MDINSSADLLCMGCMSNKNTGGVCISCGFDEVSFQPLPHHLSLRTILNGKYLVGRVLGEGGFGITYLGWDLNLDLKIAIKEYYPAGFVTRESTTANTVNPFTGEKNEFFQNGREKFVDEAKRLAKFYSLPGIVSIKDFFLENGTAYIVMEYIEGKTFKQYLESVGGKIPTAQMLELVRPLMNSLIEIHKTGIIHRDISPDNIMLTKENYIKLLDFGSARDYANSGNKSLSVMLKPGYAPEEQYRTKGIQGPWTDVYAMCATIYKAITGITPEESNERLIKDGLKKPSELGVLIPTYQEAALMNGLAIRQEDRYKSIHELVQALYSEVKQPSLGSSDINVTVPVINIIDHPSEASSIKASKTESASVPSVQSITTTKKKPFISIVAAGAIILFIMISFIVKEANDAADTDSSGEVATNNTTTKDTDTNKTYDEDTANTADTPLEGEVNIAITPQQDAQSTDTPEPLAGISTVNGTDAPTTELDEVQTNPQESEEGSEPQKEQEPTTKPVIVPQKPTATPVPTLPAWSLAKANSEGNSDGNIAMFAKVAKQGDWLFYSTDNGIFCMKEDGSVTEKLSNTRADCLNVMGNYLYYGDDYNIYRFNLTTLEEELIKDDYTYKMWVLEDGIYYSSYDGVYKINLDGSDERKIQGIPSLMYSSNASVYDGYVYYIAYGEDECIYRISTEGGGSQMLVSGENRHFTDTVIYDGSLYLLGYEFDFTDGYLTQYDNLWQCDLDGKNLTVVQEFEGDTYSFFNFLALYKNNTVGINVNGITVRKMGDDESYFIPPPFAYVYPGGIFDDYLYYQSGGFMYRLNLINGTSEALTSN